jgi:hypothetical protein
MSCDLRPGERAPRASGARLRHQGLFAVGAIAAAWLPVSRPVDSAPLPAPSPSAASILSPNLGYDDAVIRDNSFLVEEAYNQERGVVQHISTWTRFDDGGEWLYSFTQEWPVASLRHQASFTLPVRGLAGSGGAHGLGDVALSCRYQWVAARRLAFAPRVSALLPTGDADRGLETGAAGAQINLPLSVTLSRRWVAHTNLGATAVGEGHGAPGRRGHSLGQSVILVARPTIHLLLEVAWDRSEAVGSGSRDRDEHCFASPGLRWAHNLPGSVQVVPGLAVPIGVGASRGERAVFLYASVEHGF